jgi:HK97 family phage major capsid protein
MEMTPEQVIEKVNSIISEKTANAVTKEELTALKSELSALTEKSDNSDIKKAIADVEAKIEGLKESKSNPVTIKSLGQAITTAYEKSIDKIKELVEKGGTANLDVKAVGDMTIDGNYSGGVVGLSDLEQGVTRIVRRKPFLRQLINLGTTSSKYVTYIEQANPEGGAGMTAEGSLKSQADFDLIERNAVTKKVTAWIKVSKEMIADLPFMRREIDTELMELVALKLDEQILSGDGTGNNLVGILANAISWSAGTFANAITEPNNLDVLRVAISQIQGANFEPNYILMNPIDVADFDMTKTAQGEYTQPMIYTDNSGVKRYNGIQIIENTGVTAGDFLVGDFTKSNLRLREDMNIQVGFVNDDFTKNLFTILCEARATHYVKSNHYGAFVKGTFATSKTALTPAP